MRNGFYLLSLNSKKKIQHLKLGVKVHKENLKEKISSYKKRLQKDSNDHSATFHLGLNLIELKEYEEASRYLYALVLKNPDQAEVYEAASQALMYAGEFEKAQNVIEHGLKRHPDKAELLINEAAVMQYKGDIARAKELIDQIVEKHPDHPNLELVLGSFYAQIGKGEDALETLLKALHDRPDDVRLLNTIGYLYTQKEDHLTATEYYIKALRINPENPNCLNNIGNCFHSLKNVELSLKFYEEGLKLDPDHGPLICSKGTALANHGMSQEIIEEFERGLKIIKKNNAMKNSQYLIHYSNFVFFMHYVPHILRKKIYEEILRWQKEICSGIEEKEKLSFENQSSKSKKLRIGMISSGFKMHPVGQMIIRAVENIDKDKFEIYTYYDVLEDRTDHIKQQFMDVSDVNRNICSIQNYELVEIIRNDEIDIFIEMTGHAEGGKRLPLIAMRVAPVQFKWVGGLFNTTGIPQMDWLLADSVEIPEGEEKWYSEKIYRMPDDYIVYNPPQHMPDVGGLPAESNDYVTFGNLNNLTKTNSYSIELWSKILRAVPKSKMLLKGNKMDTPFVLEHLTKAFGEHGIDAERIIIEGGEPHPGFLNVYNRIDIALDPHPYTGGLTTCEALWMGVPVVTLPGETFAGRHAATHLTNADMAEFIAKDEQDYIDIAVKWANDIDGLAKLRAGMRDHVSKTPLVDGPRFARNLEKALRHMWGEWCDMKEAASKPKKVSKPKPKKSKKKK